MRLGKEVTILKDEVKDAKEKINKGLKLKGGSEVLDLMLSSQKQNKDKGGLGFNKVNNLKF